MTGSWERSLINKYFADFAEYRQLSLEEECELAQKAQSGDCRARNMLIEHNLRFVAEKAFRFSRVCGVDALDLIQEGNRGLMRAIDKFDSGHGVKLCSYASHWINAYMQRYALRNFTVQTPFNQYWIARRVKNEINSFQAVHHRQPTIEELEKSLGMDRDRIETALSARVRINHFKNSIGDDDCTNGLLLDNVVDESPDPEQETLIKEAKAAGEKILELIAEEYADHRHNGNGAQADYSREIEIYARRMKGETLQSIANDFNVTRERVRQIEKLAKKVIKKILVLYGIDTETYQLQ